MKGTVQRRRAFVPLRVLGAGGREAQVEAVLDTGFTGFLTLPPTAVAALGLPFLCFEMAHMADGSGVRLCVYDAAVLWDGEERTTFVLEMDGRPLLGMSLLEGSDVAIQVVEGGTVGIEPI